MENEKEKINLMYVTAEMIEDEEEYMAQVVLQLAKEIKQKREAEAKNGNKDRL